jgi:phosphinothricin acetyltransferase
VEHSVYVHKDHRGRGLGRVVMQELIAAARKNDVHAMIGGIDATNAGSIALHARLGFRHVGTLPQVGFKFGRWLDLAFYQLLLETPAHPVDG